MNVKVISLSLPSLSPFSYPSPTIRGHGWRTDEGLKWLERNMRERNNSLSVGLEYTKCSCLRLMKGLKEQKLKLRLYFIPKSLPVCLWGHFSYCPHSLEFLRTILEQEDVARTGCELTIFPFCPREGDVPYEWALPLGELCCEIRSVAGRAQPNLGWRFL